jgi:hypothetical protein
MKLMKQVLAASVLAFVAATSSASMAVAQGLNVEQRDAVGAVLHTLSSMIRQAKIASEYGVVSSARSMQSTTRSVFIALGEDETGLARSGIESALYGLRKIEREVGQAGNLTLLSQAKELSREYFYARSLILDSADEQTLGVSLLVDTFVKVSTAQSGSLPMSQKCLVRADSTLVGEDLGRVDGHIKLRLAQSIPSCAIGEVGNVVYIFAQHAR